MGVNLGPPGNKMTHEEFLLFVKLMCYSRRTLKQMFFCRHIWENYEDSIFPFRICYKCNKWEEI